MRKEISPSGHTLAGAIIGFGNAAVHAHLPNWRQNMHFKIQAVVESCSDQAALAEKLLPGARIYTDMGALFSHESIDFVDICTPPCFHAELMLAACQAGCHVFCEKPLVTKAVDLDRIHRSARTADRVIFSVNNWKYAPLWAKIRQIVDAGEIGQLRRLDLSVLRTPASGGGTTDWRRHLAVAGGGILLDHGWHHLYLILSLIPEIPTVISARMGFPGPEDSFPEETVDMAIRFPRAEASLHLTWRASTRSNTGSIIGDDGSILIHDDHIIIDRPEASPRRIDFIHPLSGGSHHASWMGPVMEDFYREVTGLAARGANFTEACRCARLTELAYLSHRHHGGTVSVADHDPEF